MSRFQIEDLQVDEDGKLLCAHCGAYWLHHDTVVVTDRLEDSDYGVQVSVTPISVNTNTELALHNPSSRRHGVAIALWCECCDERTWFTLEQHKGITYLKSRKEPYPLDKPTPQYVKQKQEEAAKMLAVNALNLKFPRRITK